MRDTTSYKKLIKEATKLKVFLAIFFVASISLFAYNMASNTYAADYTITLNKNGGNYNGNNGGTESISVSSSSNKNNSIGKAYKIGTDALIFTGWWTATSGGVQVFDENGYATTNGSYWTGSSSTSNSVSGLAITTSYSTDNFSGTTNSSGVATISGIDDAMNDWMDYGDVPYVRVAGSSVLDNFAWELWDHWDMGTSWTTGKYITADGKYSLYGVYSQPNDTLTVYVSSAINRTWNYSGSITLYAQYATNDIASGTYDGVDWKITASNELIIGKSGTTQNFADSARTAATDYPWYAYRSQITSVSFAGTVNGYNQMSYMFSDLTNATDMDLTGFYTNNVTGMYGMFYGCNSLANLDLGSNFDTSSVTSMGRMFYGCNSLTELDFGMLFDTSSVTTMIFMFSDCSSLTNLNLSGFNTENVTTMTSMFRGCSQLIALDISSFKTTNTTTTSTMFYSTSNLHVLKLGSNFSFVSGTSGLSGSWVKDGSTTTYTAANLASSYTGSTMAGTYRTPYTITFNPQSGTFQGTTSTSTKTLRFGSYENGVLSDVPTRSGYTFGGWYDATSNGNAVWDGNSKFVSGNYWGAGGYILTTGSFGSIHDLSGTAVSGAEIWGSTTATVMWGSTNSSGNIQVSGQGGGLNINATYENGGTLYIKINNVFYPVEISAGSRTTAKDYYIGEGWKYTGTKTVYAKWTKAASSLTKSVSPTSYVYDGSTHCPTPTVKDGSYTLTNNTHYTYSCSTTSTVGSKSLTITGSNTYHSSAKAYYTGSSSVTYYINNATLTFNATSNGGTGGGTVYTKTGVSVVYTTIRGTTTTTIPTASKSNANFLGWYTSASGGTKVLNADGSFAGSVSGYTNGSNWTTTQDRTLYAQYQNLNYTITFNPKGGTFQGTTSTSTKTVTFGSDANSSVGTPTRSGYTFDGWYTDYYELYTYTNGNSVDFELYNSLSQVTNATIKLYYHSSIGTNTYMGECTTDINGYGTNPSWPSGSEYAYAQLLNNGALYVSITVDGKTSSIYQAEDEDVTGDAIYIREPIGDQVYDSSGDAVIGKYWQEDGDSSFTNTSIYADVFDYYYQSYGLERPKANANGYATSNVSVSDIVSFWRVNSAYGLWYVDAVEDGYQIPASSPSIQSEIIQFYDDYVDTEDDSIRMTSVYTTANGYYNICGIYFPKTDTLKIKFLTAPEVANYTGNYSDYLSWKYQHNVTVSAKWTKKASSLTKSVSPTSYIYDGSSHCPTPTVSDSSTTLTNNVDYTYTCSTTSGVGSKSVTITGTNIYNQTTKAYYAGSSSVTYYINNATLTFDATTNSGTLSGTSPQYARKGTTGVFSGIRNTTAGSGTIPGATRDGYAFMGWYTDASGGTKIINPDKSIVASVSNWTDSSSNWLITSNKTLYAQYSRTKLTITETVKGNQADINKDFTFTINVQNNGTGISETYAYTGSKSGNLTFSNGNATFTLHHDQYIEVYFPTGYTYTITQTNGSYTLTKLNDSGTLNGTDIVAAFTDTLGSGTPTGIRVNILPYIILLLSSILGTILVRKFKEI